MQKKLIALAVAATLSAPAFADVTVYGKLDAGYGSIKKTVSRTGAADLTSKLDAIGFSQSTSSRLGFKVTEDLDGGMKISTVIESGLSSNPGAAAGYGTTADVATNGTTVDATSLGNREMYAKLDFGQGTAIKAGFGTSPIYEYAYAYDAALGGNFVGNLITNDAKTGGNRVVSVDAIQQFGGIKATLGLMKNTRTPSGVAAVSTETGSGLQGALQFNEGPLSAAVAFQTAKTGVPLAEVKTDITMLVGSYDLGVAKVFGQYANVKTNNAAGALTVGAGKRNFGNVGVDVPLGNFMGFAQLSFGARDEVVTLATASTSRKISGYTVGGKYSLSKRAYAYASVGETKQDAGALAVNGDGIKISQFAIGLAQVF